MKLICPECKTDVDLSVYPDIDKDQVIECNTCGISLLVTDIQDDELIVEIIEEGK